MNSILLANDRIEREIKRLLARVRRQNRELSSHLVQALRIGTTRRSPGAMALVLMVATALSLPAYAQVAVEWAAQGGGGLMGRDAADNLFTAASSGQTPGGDILLTKRNSSGVVQWQVSYDNLENSTFEAPTWVATDQAGNIIVTGNRMSGISNPVNAASIVMKFDPSGNLLWRQVYEGSFDGSYTKKSLIDSDNTIYVLGIGQGPAGRVTKVKKFTPDGAALWSYFDSTGIGSPLNMKFAPDGNILIVGSATTIIKGFAKIDKNGNHLWNSSLNGDGRADAAGDQFGNTYLASGPSLKKVSPTGQTLWERANPISGSFVEVGSDNNPVISGLPNPATAGVAFAKFNSNGGLLWQNLDADGRSLVLIPNSYEMKLDEFNNAYLGAGNIGVMGVSKVNSDGTSAWTATVQGFYASTVIEFGAGGSNGIYASGGGMAKFVQGPDVPAEADLGLSLTAFPSTVTQGQQVTYTIQATNNGPALARDIMVTGSLPACAIGQLAPGATARCTRTAIAAAPGAFTQTMTVDNGAQPDPNPSNNSQTVSTQVTPVSNATDLSLVMVDAPDPVRRGSNVIYTLTVANSGPANASNVALTDVLPANTTLVSAVSTSGLCSGAGTVSCLLGTLNANATATVTITVRTRLRGTINNSASVTSDASTTDFNTANNSATAVTTVR